MMVSICTEGGGSLYVKINVETKVKVLKNTKMETCRMNRMHFERHSAHFTLGITISYGGKGLTNSK